MNEAQRRGCIITAIERWCVESPESEVAIIGLMKMIAGWTDGAITLDMVQRAQDGAALYRKTSWYAKREKP